MNADTSSAVSVLAADSHPLALIGLIYIIRRAPALSLIAAVSTGAEALALIRERTPKVAILDARLPDLDAREITRTLQTERSATRTLLLSEHQTGELILQTLTAGATGLITRHATPQDVLDAITASSRGESVLPPDFGPDLADALTQRSDTTASTLTDREHQILRFLAQGASAANIATQLDIANNTVKTHIQNLYGKLGVNDRAAAVATAIRRGIIN